MTDSDRWGPTQSGGNERSMTYTQPCPTLYHLCLHSTAQGLEEEEGWRSLSGPSPRRCLESFVKVCHWLWGYLVPLMEDDRKDIRLVSECVRVCVCVCVCVFVCECQEGGAIVRVVGFHLVSQYKNPSSIRHVQLVSANQAGLTMWSWENKGQISP